MAPRHSLPSPLADFWAGVQAEPDPRIRLQSLTNLLDLVARWSVVLALGAHRVQGDGDLPQDLRQLVRSLELLPR